MELFVRFLVQAACLFALTQAIPVSLLEDMKEAKHAQTPARSNKVKRAQEVLMFGNQQNRANDNPGYSSYSRTEKRASDFDDNTLSEGVVPMPILPQVEEQAYDTNNLEAGGKDYSYQYPLRELPYSMLFRNPAYRQAYRGDPVLSYGDMPIYNMMDVRRKREVHAAKSAVKSGFRPKREFDLNPEEMISLLRLWEMDRKPKLEDSRLPWTNNYGGLSPLDLDMESQYEPDEDEGNYNGIWYDVPIPTQNSREPEVFWPRQEKRFMITKREVGNGKKRDFTDGIPLYRRMVL